MNGVFDHEDGSRTVSRRRSAPSVSVACVALYLGAVLGLVLAILHRDDRVFTYTLDDPYIHLALAQGIAHGTYGINPGEPSSPSSSILWPFLLVPFADFSWSGYTPLVFNMLFCGLAAWLLGRIVDRWPWSLPAPPGSIALAWLTRFAAAAALMLAANLAGLTLVGMEHGLQVLLAVACAFAMVEAFAGRAIPGWCVAAAVLSPAVRYEGFALVAAVAIALNGQRRRRAALAAVLLSCVVPAAFSLFLISRGLSPLPSSVLVKSKIYRYQGGVVLNAIHTLARGVAFYAHTHTWQAQLLILLLLLWLLVLERERVRRFVLAGAVLAALLQLIVGQFNWFFRYEVYALIFTLLVACTAILHSSRLRPRNAVVLCVCWIFAARYLQALYETPAAAANVYQQQYQMHRFIAGYYRKNVAVNDLGWVSFSRPPGVYVLDLWGLASPAASRQYYKGAAWLDAITREHNAGVAIIYPGWFDEPAPEDWTALGTMCLTTPPVSAARDCVVFYSTAVGDRAALAGEMARFARSLPPSVRMTLSR